MSIQGLLKQKREIFICLLLIVMVVIPYGQTIHHEFVDFDDEIYITLNPNIKKGFTIEGLACAFTSCAMVQGVALWHPLTWVSLLADYSLYGLNPAGYHVTNILLHIANTLLLFLLLNRMTGAPWRSGLVAALFAVHPLHVESVAWVTERKDVLSGFFGLAAIGAYLSYTKRRRFVVYLLVTFLFACSLMAKPMLVTLPFVLLLLDFWPLGRWTLPLAAVEDGAWSSSGENTGSAGRTKKRAVSHGNEKNALVGSSFLRCLAEKIPLILISAAYSLVTYWIYRQQDLVSHIIPLSVRLSNALISYVSYIAKMFLPLELAMLYPYTVALPPLHIAGAALFLIFVTVCTLLFARRLPYLPVGWFGYLGTLLPVIGIIQVGQQAMADRYTYLPLIGLFIIIVWGFHDLVSRWRYAKKLSVVAAIVTIAALMPLSWMQIGYWKNSSSLFRHALAVTRDNHLAHVGLAVSLEREGNLKEALLHYQEAVHILPDPLYLTDLGTLHGTLGQTNEAIACFRQALDQREDLERAHYNLGVMMHSKGQDREALAHLQRSIQLNPRRGGARFMIGNMLVQQGLWREAQSYFEDEARLGSKNALLYNDLGTVYYKLGQREKGLACYNRALAIEPDNKLVKDNMKAALTKYGRSETQGSCP
jgi:tetratricopeptide (TPR) repeat protein